MSIEQFYWVKKEFEWSTSLAALAGTLRQGVNGVDLAPLPSIELVIDY